MSQPPSLPGGSGQRQAAEAPVRKLRSPNKRPAALGFGTLCISASTSVIKESRPANTAEQPKRPLPGAVKPPPLSRLKRNVASSAANIVANITTGATGSARPKVLAMTAALAPSAAGKRKHWDLQGRIHDLEERMKGLSGEKEQLSLQSTTRAQRETVLTFSFDRVFPGVASQAEVYAEVSQLVQSALDGYHVCIFAYGQTGAGKTHTMEGDEDDELRGIIPRAFHQVFEASQKQPQWTYTMVASFVEVYNETLRDLLVPPSQADKAPPLLFKMSSKDGPVTVASLTEVPVQSAQQIGQLLRCARRNQAVAATKCNERSSRSHSVFRLDITGHNAHTQLGCRGRLNLVDLAGSERLSVSQSAGARLREAQNINRSLANLGHVVLALSNRADHVPYQNSKLTHLLMDSLGGNSKTLMLLHISPREENIGETINSLRFATTVNQCQIGTARKNLSGLNRMRLGIVAAIILSVIV